VQRLLVDGEELNQHRSIELVAIGQPSAPQRRENGKKKSKKE
jgi:hypothetical protein